MSLLIGGSQAPPTAPVAGGQPEPVDTMVSVGDHSLHLVIRRGTRPLTIVLEAGGGSDLGGWYEVPALLARETGATVVAYDRAGFGRSEPGAPDLTPDQEIGNLYGALSAVAVPEKTVHVGHSYGGLLALLSAARFPDRVQGVVLVDPMNPRFVASTGDFVFSTAQRIENPSTVREHATMRLINGFPDLLNKVGAAEPALVQPIVIVTAGRPWWGRADIDQAWRQSHTDIAAASPLRRLIVAQRSQHDVPQQEPETIVAAVTLLDLPDRP
ncbi:MAG TPA: alpha/beta hydrolase family protein [Longimicrobium sp.]|nr:alpha/beta hydrolase family protein [Longimicrobium sp.]